MIQPTTNKPTPALSQTAVVCCASFAPPQTQSASTAVISGSDTGSYGDLAASSARLYWESFREVGEWFSEATTDTVPVPTGCSVFPKEMPRPSRRWAAARYPDIRHWGEPDRGGHFAAFEQPHLFASELRAFFRLVR